MCRGSKFLYQLGRILFALPFIVFFVLKVVNWQSSMDSLGQALSMWKTEVEGSFLGSFIGVMQQLDLVLLILACLFEGLGGILLLFGIRTRLAGWLLVLFLLPVTIFMHPFWFADATSRFPMLADFFKNLALLGGAFVFAAGANCHNCHCHEETHHMDDRV
jgi:uncharacterized membrane protein YphA (DoxX/SURF4 family)